MSLLELVGDVVQDLRVGDIFSMEKKRRADPRKGSNLGAIFLKRYVSSRVLFAA